MAFANKTVNMYEMSKEECAKVVNDNVTKTFLQRTTSTKMKIDNEAKHFSKKLKLENKMEQYPD